MPTKAPTSITPRKTKRYGFRRGLLDVRDKRYAPCLAASALPASVDLRPQMPKPDDQEQEGACTSFSTLKGFRFARTKAGHADLVFSHNFLYYNSRAAEGSTGSDAGAELRDVCKVLNKLGVCLETEWPYTQADMLKKPSAQCYTDALKYTATSYLSVAVTRAAIQGCLAEGYPVIVGISVYASFESDAVIKSGVVPMPKKSESLLGGHAILCVGYDTAANYAKKYANNTALVAALSKVKPDTLYYELENSWGESVMNGGFFLLPATYLESSKYASDFWTIRVASA